MTLVRDASHVTKRICFLKKKKGKKEQNVQSESFIEHRVGVGGRTYCMRQSHPPLIPSCFLPLLPLVKKSSHVYSPADLCHVLFVFSSWYSAAVPLSFF